MKTRIWVLMVSLTVLLAACGGASDADLKAKAETALKGDPATSSVAVDVKGGVATVTGEVADDAARAKASELAKVEGVNSVVNEVTVAAPPAPTPSADDATLKTKVEDALKAKNCGEGVSVDVAEGVVTLRGTVAEAKYSECIMAANETKPKRVENQMKKGK